MKKYLKKHRKLIGSFLLILSIVFFIFWELIGRKELLFSEVVVLSKEVQKGQAITEDMLAIIKLEEENIIENAIIDKYSIIGLEAKHYVPAKTQLVMNYFDEPALVLSDGKKIMSLPNRWIYSFPETLRRKDEIYLYAIKENAIENKSPVNKKDLCVIKTRVAYVKDNANREVTCLDSERLVGSSVISEIEIVIKEEEFQLLADYVNKGYVFSIMYE